jgi:hypothetical protein
MMMFESILSQFACPHRPKFAHIQEQAPMPPGKGRALFPKINEYMEMMPHPSADATSPLEKRNMVLLG